jgi:hypothetical protein
MSLLIEQRHPYSGRDNRRSLMTDRCLSFFGVMTSRHLNSPCYQPLSDNAQTIATGVSRP